LNFTAREEYGLLATVHLGLHGNGEPIQSREIARAEGIPEQFLEQVMAGLRRAGVARSIRGASGGYVLARPAREITAGDVLRALSGPIVPIKCVNPEAERCEKLERCAIADLWQRVQSAVTEVLDNTTIQDLVDKRTSLEEQGSFMMHI